MKKPTAAPPKMVKSIKAGFFLLSTFGFLFLNSGCHIQADKNHYVLAERLFADHNYAAAVDEFHKIVESNPRSSLAQQALFRIATIQFLYLEKYPESARNYRQFAILSQNADLVFQAEKNIGDIYFSKLDAFKESQKQYQLLFDRYPKSEDRPFFLLRIARSHYGSLEFDDAIKAYKRILKEYPKDPVASEAMYQLGNTYFTKGDCDLAIDAFQDLILGFPASQQAVLGQFGIGNCYEDMGRRDEALEIYTKIVDRYPAKSVIASKIQRLKEKQARRY